jgi:hypothetical protein
MRVFVDEEGAEWVVWEVRPEKALFGRVERRVGGDRREVAAPDPVIERRQVLERRVRAGPLGAGGGRGVPGASGWLAFQSGTTRRRLVPIPADWRELSDADLAALCRRAAPAPPGAPIT